MIAAQAEAAVAGSSGGDGVERPSEHQHVEAALQRLGHGGRWLRTIFLFGSSPGVLNAMHLGIYVFLAQESVNWCTVAGLAKANWTVDQARNLSAASSCSIFAWNYTELVDLPFSAALNVTRELARPPEIPCDSHVFLESEPGSSIVSEWSLVCDKSSLRSTAQVALAVGKIIGALLFGCISDRMGRKTSFVAASLLYIVAGPAVAFSYHFAAFLFFRAALGAAATGTFNSAFTILMESTHPSRRPSLGVLFNLSYPVGFLALPALALILSGWRPLQLAISVPALLLLLPCWFLPESPRWLLTQGRVREAMHIIRHAQPRLVIKRPSVLMDRRFSDDQEYEPEEEHKSCWTGTGPFLRRLASLFHHRELRLRLILVYTSWFACAITYHSLALSAATLLQQPHRYAALLGAIELPAYLIPLFILRHLGRRATCVLLLLGSAASLLSLLVIPPGWSLGVLAAAMAGRLCVSAAYSVVTLHTSELFPTTTRNTAIGTCSTVAQLGSITAPYLVDMSHQLGSSSAFIPSVVCGIATAFAGIVTLALPETCDLPLLDTVEQARSRSTHELKVLGSGENTGMMSSVDSVVARLEDRP